MAKRSFSWIWQTLGLAAIAVSILTLTSIAATYSRNPSGSSVEGYAVVTVNNNGDCGGFGGFSHSWFFQLDFSGGQYYSPLVEENSDTSHDFSFGCGQTVCDARALNVCTHTTTISCPISFTTWRLACGDGGSSGGPFSDAWTLSATSTPATSSPLRVSPGGGTATGGQLMF